jgi:thiamine-phosphate pyrophosphorylase
MIIISSPISVPNEINLIHSLFEEGMELLHVRKPDFTTEELQAFVTTIGLEYRKRLVLQSHHHLAKALEINRIHFIESSRITHTESELKRYKELGLILSTSTHCIEDFNELDSNYAYAFLSPVHPSISKMNYVSKIDLFEAIKKRNNFKTKVIALGGILAKNIKFTLTNGFDDVALLGTIWNQNNPIENFKICQKIALSF